MVMHALAAYKGEGTFLLRPLQVWGPEPRGAAGADGGHAHEAAGAGGRPVAQPVEAARG